VENGVYKSGHLGYTCHMQFIPEHQTNNLILRFIANQIFHRISHMFLSRSLRIYYIYENEYDEDNSFVPPKFDHLRIRTYNWLYNVLDKPYSRWGTHYDISFDDEDQELMDRLGSDYDENGIPYWEKTGTVDPDYDLR